MKGLWKKSLALVVALVAITTVVIVGTASATTYVTIHEVSVNTNTDIHVNNTLVPIGNASPGQTMSVDAPTVSNDTYLTGYQLVSGQTNPKQVTINSDGSAEVTFSYEQTNYGTITVNYQDQSGNIVGTAYYNNLTYGSHSITPVAPSGYTLDSSAPQSVNITPTDYNQTVTFPVTNNTYATVTVNYTFNGNTITSQNVNVYYGNNYIYPQDASTLPLLAGYEPLSLVPQIITVGTNNVPSPSVVNFALYSSTQQLINVFYVDVTTNQNIVTGQTGPTGTTGVIKASEPIGTTSMAISGYEYDLTSYGYTFDHATGAGLTGSALDLPGTASTQNVYLYYKSTSLVPVNIVMQTQDGTQIGSMQQDYLPNQAAKIYAPTINGYTLCAPPVSQSPQTINSVSATGNNQVIFTYASTVTPQVTVNYVDDQGTTLQPSVTLTADDGLALGATNDIGTILTNQNQLKITGYVLEDQNMFLYLNQDQPTAALTLVYTKDVAQVTYSIYAKDGTGATTLLTPTPVTANFAWNADGTATINLSQDATGYTAITAQNVSSGLTNVTGAGYGTTSPTATFDFTPSSTVRAYNVDFYYTQPTLTVTRKLVANGTTVQSDTLTGGFFYGTNTVLSGAMPAGYSIDNSSSNSIGGPYGGPDASDNYSQQIPFTAGGSTTATATFDMIQSSPLTVNVVINKYTDGSVNSALYSTETQTFTGLYGAQTLLYGGNYPITAGSYATMAPNASYVQSPTDAATQRTIDLTGYVLKPGSANNAANYTLTPVAGETGTYAVTATFDYIPDTHVTVQINKLLPNGSVDTVLVPGDTTTYQNVPFGAFSLTNADVATLLTADNSTADVQGYNIQLPSPLTLTTTQTTGTYIVNYVLPSLTYTVSNLQMDDPSTTSTVAGTELNNNLVNNGLGSLSSYINIPYGPVSYGAYTTGIGANQDVTNNGYTLDRIDVSTNGGQTWTTQNSVTFDPVSNGSGGYADQNMLVRVYYDIVPTSVRVTLVYPDQAGDYAGTYGYTTLGSVVVNNIPCLTSLTSPNFMTWTGYNVADADQQTFLDQVQQALEPGVNFGSAISWPSNINDAWDAWTAVPGNVAWAFTTDGVSSPTPPSVNITLVVDNPNIGYGMDFYREYTDTNGQPLTGLSGVTQDATVYPYLDSSTSPATSVYVKQNMPTDPDRFPTNNSTLPNEETISSNGISYVLYDPIDNTTDPSQYSSDFLQLSTNIANYTNYGTENSVTVGTTAPNSSTSYRIIDTLEYVPATSQTVTYKIENPDGTLGPIELTQTFNYFNPTTPPANVSLLGASSYVNNNGTVELGDIPTALSTNGWVSVVTDANGNPVVTNNIQAYLQSKGYMVDVTNPTAVTSLPTLTDGNNSTVVPLVTYVPRIYIDAYDKTTGQLLGTTATDEITPTTTALAIPDYNGYTYVGGANGVKSIPASSTLAMQQVSDTAYQIVNGATPAGQAIDSPANNDQTIQLYYVPSEGNVTINVYGIEPDGSSTNANPDGSAAPVQSQSFSRVIDFGQALTPSQTTSLSTDFLNNYSLTSVQIYDQDGNYVDTIMAPFDAGSLGAARLATDYGYSLTQNPTTGQYTFAITSASDVDYGRQINLIFQRNTANLTLNYQYYDASTNSWTTGYTNTLTNQSLGATVNLDTVTAATYTVTMNVNGTDVSFTRLADASQDLTSYPGYPNYTIATGDNVVNLRYGPTTPGTIHVKLVDNRTGLPIPIAPLLNAVNANGDAYTLTGIVGITNAVTLRPDLQTELTNQGFVLMGSATQNVDLSSDAPDATVTFQALQPFGGSVKVVYTDLTSGAVIGTDDVYQLPFMDGYSFTIPSTYEANNGLTLGPVTVTTVNGTTPSTVGTDTYGNNVVTFDMHKVSGDPNNLYTINVGYNEYPCSVTVNVVDQSNNPLWSTTYQNVPYGPFTVPVNDICSAFPGYELAPNQSGSVTVNASSTATSQIVPIQLVAKLCSIEVVYYDTTDDMVIKREVIPANYTDDQYNPPYVLAPIALTGYTFVGNNNPTTVSFAPTDDVLQRIKTVTFDYAPNNSQTQGVNVVFKDAATGNPVYTGFIAAAKNSNVTVKSADFLQLSDLAGYQLAAGQQVTQNICITAAAPLKTCTFMVEPRTAQVTVQSVLVDTYGNPVLDATGNQTILNTQTTAYAISTTSYALTPPSIAGYLFYSGPQQLSVIDESPQTVVLKYTEAPVSVTAQAVIDDNGTTVTQSLPDLTVANPVADTPYTLQAPDLGPGYTLTGDPSVTVTADVYNNYQALATFNYTKNYYSVTVQGVDDSNSGTQLYADAPVSLPYGSHDFNAQDLTGYTISGDATQNVLVDQDNMTVTFHYTESAHGYNLVYLDTTDGGSTVLSSVYTDVTSAYSVPVPVDSTSIAPDVYTDSSNGNTYRLVSQSVTSVTPTADDPYPTVICYYQQFTGVPITGTLLGADGQPVEPPVGLDSWDLTGSPEGTDLYYIAAGHSAILPTLYDTAGNSYTLHDPLAFDVRLTSTGPEYLASDGTWQPVPAAGLTFNYWFAAAAPLTRSAPVAAMDTLSAPLTVDPSVGSVDPADGSTISDGSNDASTASPSLSNASTGNVDPSDIATVSPSSNDLSTSAADPSDASTVSPSSSDPSTSTAAPGDASTVSAGSSDGSAVSSSDASTDSASSSDSSASSTGSDDGSAGSTDSGSSTAGV